MIRNREKDQMEEAELLHRIDVQINLKRLLRNNEKYIGLTRNVKKPDNIFGKIIMNRLMQDTYNGKYDDPNKRPSYSFDHLEAKECHRFASKSQQWEENYLRRVFDTKFERPHFHSFSVAKDMSLESQKARLREHVSHSINEFDFMKHKNEPKTDRPKKSKQNNDDNDEDEDDDESTEIIANPTNNESKEPSQSITKSDSTLRLPKLQPKKQIVKSFPMRVLNQLNEKKS